MANHWFPGSSTSTLAIGSPPCTPPLLPNPPDPTQFPPLQVYRKTPLPAPPCRRSGQASCFNSCNPPSSTPLNTRLSSSSTPLSTWTPFVLSSQKPTTVESHSQSSKSSTVLEATVHLNPKNPFPTSKQTTTSGVNPPHTTAFIAAETVSSGLSAHSCCLFPESNLPIPPSPTPCLNQNSRANPTSQIPYIQPQYVPTSANASQAQHTPATLAD